MQKYSQTLQQLRAHTLILYMNHGIYYDINSLLENNNQNNAQGCECVCVNKTNKSYYKLEALIDELLNKHESRDGYDGDQQLHQICVNNITTNIIRQEKELQCRTT